MTKKNESPVMWVQIPHNCNGIVMDAPQTMMLTLPCTVLNALQAIGIAKHDAEQLLQAHCVAIWGRRSCGHTQLKPNDRIEILTPLTFNPMESRRRRAAHRARQAQQKV